MAQTIINIEDNFLDQEKFDELVEIMMSSRFPWFYGNGIDYVTDVDKFQFVHNFWNVDAPCSYYYTNVTPILQKAKAMSLWRIKANLLTKTPTIVENEFHIDTGEEVSEEKSKQLTTSIFYINTNNGYTKFEDGTKVESVANRFVTFPSNMKHTGTSCTDEKTRVVINFNYFK